MKSASCYIRFSSVGMSPHTIYRTVELAPDAPVEMKLHDCQMLDGDYAWLRYRVVK